MTLSVGVPAESIEGEDRVAVLPTVVGKWKGLGIELIVQRGAGEASGAHDDHFEEVRLVDDAESALGADVVLKVQPPTKKEIGLMKKGAIVAGFMNPSEDPERIKAMRDAGITAFSVELIPRISRAQAMDALSSQANIAGYKAVLIGANKLRRFFPMLTTAAGTIRPATVLVIGAGVAGLQAIATAKRLGARVEAFDVRTETAEQVESLGAKFIDTGVKAEGEGGYARELTDEEKRQQQEALADHVAKADVVITTAAIPGKKAPQIIDRAMVERMSAGSVIVDIAAETGGNCELTEAGRDVDHQGVVVVGPVNLPAKLAEHASQMYAKNLFNYISPMIEEGELNLDWDDEVYAKSVVVHDGEIRHEPTREAVEGAKS